MLLEAPVMLRLNLPPQYLATFCVKPLPFARMWCCQLPRCRTFNVPLDTPATRSEPPTNRAFSLPLFDLRFDNPFPQV